MDRVRLTRLNKQLEAIIFGRQPIGPHNSSTFIEAICAQQDRASSISKVIAGKNGLSAIQSAMRFTLDASFFNGDATKFLTYLQSQEISDLGAGTLLYQVVQKIIDPPVFWSAFSEAYATNTLTSPAEQCFGWLLHYLVANPYTTSQYRDQASLHLPSLLSSKDPIVRAHGDKIKLVLNACSPGAVLVKPGAGPGGRHDNDFSDFREISIVPSADEIQCTKVPFLRSCTEVDSVDADSRIAAHLDNQFRLLREDMIYELKEEVQIALGKKKGRHRGTVVEGLQLVGLYCGPDNKRTNWGMTFKCPEDLPGLKGLKEVKDRKKALADNRNLLRHQSLACLLVDGEIVAFPTIHREEELMTKDPPIIVLQVEGESTTQNTLIKLKTGREVKLFQIDTAMFSYAPILQRLKDIRELPLLSDLLLWDDTQPIVSAPGSPDSLVQSIRMNHNQDLKGILDTPRSIQLDRYQADSLVAGLSQRVSLIQGPPGTGKSLIGALIAKGLYQHTRLKILVVCYTNHALDDILTSLLDIGIPQESMVRLGGKSTTRTEPLLLQRQKSTFRRDRGAWAIIDNLKGESQVWYENLQDSFSRYLQASTSLKDILEYLEFADEDHIFFTSFLVPGRDSQGLQRVGRAGKVVDNLYLIQRWAKGEDAGVFSRDANQHRSPQVWGMQKQARQLKLEQWRRDILKEQIEGLYSVASKFNSINDQLANQWAEKDTEILRDKTIIGCTTTAAAKYSNSLQAVAPDVLLVEEAGEILESHVVTALSQRTKQLILIGDHKQLRPKVNHYRLTVEKGEGFDLNRSLFERLILRGYPHKTLTKQHRMRPQISALIRSLTYPELSDASSTHNRPNLRGVQSDIVFISHAHPEDNFAQIADKRDGGSKSSKQNTYEVNMVLRILRYLAQQGYSTEQMVILTPYLGQLHKLQAALRSGRDVDPLLNDLDSHDLVKAGLMTAAAAKMAKKPIRLATIDNYQGEESDVVIVSLTRSNPQNDIGFMFSPERLNVLLSRARNALIMIGNANTFSKSRKGGELWGKLFKLLRDGQHVFEGLPIVCQRHPDQKALLKSVTDFDLFCPDGGCARACGVILGCGLHPCNSRCHQIVDHSKMRCENVMRSLCSSGHQQTWKCYQGRHAACNQCERDRKAAEEQRLKEYELQQQREAEQLKHNRDIDALNAQIAEQERLAQEARLAGERAAVIRQKEEDLKNLKIRVAQLKNANLGEVSKKSTSLTTDGRPKDPIAQPPTNSITDPSNSLPRPNPSSSDPPPSSQSSAPSNNQPNPPTPPDSRKDENSKVQPPSVTTPLGTFQSPTSMPASPSSSQSQAPKPKAPKIIPPLPPSPSETEWQRQKSMEGALNAALDELMGMIGLEDVKETVLTIKAAIDIKKRQGVSLMNERLNSVFLGNPGTGKTTVARIYAKFLASVQAIPNDYFLETTGSRLANDGVDGAKKLLEGVLTAGGGAFFIDEAYQLSASHNSQGKQVLDFLLAEMENHLGKVVFILAGYNREMESFFEHNPGLPSRVPQRFLFADYNDSELLAIFKGLITKTYTGNMVIEDGLEGLYVRIVIRRLASARGKPGFGNARELQIVFQRICRAQAKRIREARKHGLRPNDFYMTKEDLIGPRPSDAIQKCEAWTELQSLIGLSSVKDAVRALTDTIETNYQREIDEVKPLQFSLNRIFLGSPGTGKTTVANLYGRILADLRVLSNGEVVVKNPSDFVGGYLGQSEQQTKAILATTRGKVLIIDEAYMLYGGRDGHSKSNDSFKTAVIDTIVAEVQNVPGDDRCVLLLGYKDPMMEMFQNVNEGLSRRFAIDDPFLFEDFSPDELRQILDRKLKTQDIDAAAPAKDVAMQLLERAKNRPNFGNGGEVENILTKAKLRYQQRTRSQQPRPAHVFLQPVDFDPDFDRATRSTDNLKKLFEDMVGLGHLAKQLESYQAVVKAAKEKNMDYRDLIPFNFIFKGPPGTGKTTVARKMGQVYYDMGILATTEVVECSASDLVGQYVGQTGPKTQKLVEKALGQVLFIDEAYRLSQGNFAQEAVDELVGLLTQDKYKGKLIVVLAGYDQDMNQLLAVNSGLSSRFPEQLTFTNMSPPHCIQVLEKKLLGKNVRLPGIDSPSSDVYEGLSAIITKLSALPSWGNARDIVTLAQKMVQEALLSSITASDGKMELAPSTALRCAQVMLSEQRGRLANLNQGPGQYLSAPMQTNTPSSGPPPSIGTSTNTAQKSPATSNSPTSTNDGRDPGVPDDLWNELQQAKKAEEAKKKKDAEDAARLAREAEEKERQARLEEQRAEETRKALEKAKLEEQQRLELQKRLEQERLKAAEARRLAAEAEQKRKEEEERQRKEKEKEVKIQAELRRIGKCPRGFHWIRIAPYGYRCAGGTHFVQDSQLPTF